MYVNVIHIVSPIYKFMRLLISVCAILYMPAFVCNVYVYICTHIYACMFVYTQVGVDECMSVFVYICT